MRNEHTRSKASPKLKTSGAKMPGEKGGNTRERGGNTWESGGNTRENGESFLAEGGIQERAFEGLEHMSQRLCE